MKKLAELIATCGYIGKIKYAPGTFGSLPGFLICYLLMQLGQYCDNMTWSEELSFYENQVLTILFFEIIGFIALFFLGTICTNIYIKDKLNKDPKEVVIDEVVGQMLTIIICFISSIILFFSPIATKIDLFYFDLIFMLFLPFGLFRLFDISKPWPISWVDKTCKNGLGVMLDDIIAALFAGVTHYIIVITVTKLL